MAHTSVTDQIRDEIRAMTAFALGGELDVPPSVVAIAVRLEQGTPLSEAEWNQAVRAHRRLQRLVAPALPKTILLFEEERQEYKRFTWLPSLGPVRLVRQLAVLSMVLLALFVGLALSPAVDCEIGPSPTATATGSGQAGSTAADSPETTPASAAADSPATTTCVRDDLFRNDGWELLVNLLFLLTAAGLGATFSGLWRAMSYIGAGTFDTKYEATYWVRIVLGLVSGLLLSELLPAMLAGGETTNYPFARPVLALVGGFSADVLFRILQRLASAVESMFKGDATAVVQSEIRRANAVAAQQVADLRLRLSSRLVRLHEQIQSSAGSDDAVAAVRKILDEVMSFDGVTDDDSHDSAPASDSSGSEAETG